MITWIKARTKNSLNAFRICIFLFCSYSFGVKRINKTFISSQRSLENPTRFQTKMGKVCTRFRTKKAQKPRPLRRHIPIWLIQRSTPPPPEVLPQFSGKSSLTTPNDDQGQEPMIVQCLWLQSRLINNKKTSIQVDMRR